MMVEYAFFGRGDMQPALRFTYALDGSESTNSVMMGRGIQVQKSKAVWDGGKLVITTVHAFKDADTGEMMTSEVKQVLTLESPTTLIVETTRGAIKGGLTTSSRTVYRKN